MDFDFSRSSQKLKDQQKKRQEEARKKLERERKLQQQAKQKQQEIEEQLRLKRMEEAKKAEEERKRQVEEAIRTGGIDYSETLTGQRISGEGDKVTLPPSALEALTRQDAFGRGPLFFELRAAPAPGTGAAGTTHCGVLEFTAEEGCVGLPPKVLASLGIAPEQDNTQHQGVAPSSVGQVQIKYIRLEKATFAKIRPEKAGLSQIDEIRAVLEHNMRNHATLSLGDKLIVWFRGKAFECEVLELRPAAACTVIDTDVELELDLPAEASRAAAAAAGQVVGGGQRLSGAAATAAPSPPPPPPPGPMDADSDASSDDDDDDEPGGAAAAAGEGGAPAAAAAAAAARRAHAAARARALPAEPALGAPGALELALLHLPPREGEGGGEEKGRRRRRAARRFRRSHPLEALLDFAEAEGAWPPGGYRVVRRFPRAVFSRGGGGPSDAAAAAAGAGEGGGAGEGPTLEGAGITGNEAFVVEGAEEGC